MSDIGSLDRHRAALGAAAQPSDEGEHDQQAEHGGSVGEGVGSGGGAQRLIADVVAGDDDRTPTEDAGQVHVVGEVEPLGVAEAAGAAGAAQIGERRCHDQVARYWPPPATVTGGA